MKIISFIILLISFWALANDDEIIKNLDFYENFEAFTDENYDVLLEEDQLIDEDKKDE